MCPPTVPNLIWKSYNSPAAAMSTVGLLQNKLVGQDWLLRYTEVTRSLHHKTITLARNNLHGHAQQSVIPVAGCLCHRNLKLESCACACVERFVPL